MPPLAASVQSGNLAVASICPRHGPVVQHSITQLVASYHTRLTERVSKKEEVTVAVIFASAYGAGARPRKPEELRRRSSIQPVGKVANRNTRVCLAWPQSTGYNRRVEGNRREVARLIPESLTARSSAPLRNTGAGNTGRMADGICSGLTKAGVNVKLMDCEFASAADVTEFLKGCARPPEERMCF